jgi:hypothetical protein
MANGAVFLASLSMMFSDRQTVNRSVEMVRPVGQSETQLAQIPQLAHLIGRKLSLHTDSIQYRRFDDPLHFWNLFLHYRLPPSFDIVPPSGTQPREKP